LDLTSILIGFLAGIVFHRFLSGIYELGQIGLYIREIEKSALVMLASSAESIAFIQTLKYKKMKDLGVGDSTIATTKNIDDYNFIAWKNSAVSNLLAAYPEKYKAFARYVDWESGMEFLNKVYKKGHKE